MRQPLFAPGQAAVGKICRLQLTPEASTQRCFSYNIMYVRESCTINKSQVSFQTEGKIIFLLSMRIRMRHPFRKIEGINPSPICGNGCEISLATAAEVVKTKLVQTFNGNINRIFITESQKGWGWVRRDIWRSAGPNPAAQARPRAGCPAQCPDLHGDFITPPSSLQQCSTTLTAKEFPDLQREPLVTQFVAPLPLILLLDTTEKSLVLPTLHPPLKYLSTLMTSP